MQTPWSDEERAMLRRLRRNGIGTSQAAVMMGRSVNSIRRQLKYLGLIETGNQPRPSAPKPEPVQRAGRQTLPPLSSLRETP